jgi:AcrR family transcriptional regulator
MTETWRASEKAQRRSSYLHAAAHLFAERGYRAVSIDDLGAAVGVSGPALYNHFASKEEILIELLTGASERLLEGFMKTTSGGGSDLETLHDLIEFHLDFALPERDIIRIQDRELANLPTEANHRVRRLQRSYMDGWQEIVGRLRPDLAAADLRVRMHALFGALNSTPHSDRVDDATDVRAALADAALWMLLGPTVPAH